jgi:EmrB/QacA subfamily drug resistance transporter
MSHGGPSSDKPEVLTRQQKAFTLIGTLLGMLLAALDQTIVATAGPLIQRDLSIEPGHYAWITTAYLVTSTVFVPLYGKLSDMYGRKRVLLVGMSIFLIGSACCGIAQSAAQLIAARVLQGTGAASLFTTAFAVVADLFPPAERGKYQGLFGAAFGFSSVAGPLAGGFIADRLGWHWAFFINLPIGLVAMLFIITRMPPLRRPRLADSEVDVAGTAALVLAVVPLLVGLSLDTGAEGSAGGLPWHALALFGTSAIGLALFIAIERRARDPLFDLRLFSIRTFAIGNGATFVLGMAFLGAIVFLPLFMVNVVGLTATHAGLTTTPLTFGIVAGNIGSGQLVARTGRYKPLMLGAIGVSALGFSIMGLTLSTHSTQLEVSLKMVLLGLGLGPSIPLYTLAVQNAVAPSRIGVATSAATFFRSIGATIGLAVLGSVFAATFTSSLQARAPHARADSFTVSPEGSEGALATDSSAIDMKMHAAPQPDAQLRLDEAQAQKLALTDAIRRVYQLCIAIAFVAFLVVLALPELPLQRLSNAPRPPE